jgi:hypothetical protein
MTIRELRYALPRYTWTAGRHGLRWRYLGLRDTERVEVYAVGRLCGPADDDVATHWLIDDGVSSTDFSSWLMQHFRSGNSGRSTAEGIA